MSDYQLNLIFLGKDDGASEMAEKIAAGLKKVGDESEKTEESGGSIFSKFTVTAGDAIGAVQAVAGKIGDLGHALIDGNAQFEQYNVAYTTLIKNSDDFKAANKTVTDGLQLNALASDAAKQHMQDLADFGAKTPFDLPGVVEADTVLQGFGLNSTAAADKFGFAGKDILTIAGDVASGTGTNFKEMALVLGKFSTGATGEAISRMQELGITNREEMAKMGLTFSKAGQLMSPLPQAMNTVLTIMKTKYGGLMDAQSATFNGMLSNLDDWKGATMRQLGEPIFDALKPQLSGLLTLLGSDATKQAISAFATGIGDGITAVGDIASVVRDYGIPAMEGLTVATALYGLTTLPAALPGIIAATTAFAAQAVAAAAVALPLAAVAVMVAAVAKSYDDLKQKNEDATTALLEQRQWWNDSTQALKDFDGASDETKGRLAGLKTAVEENRTELEREITSLAMRREAGLVNDSQYATEMATINQHRVAVTASSQALEQQTQTLEHLHDTDSVEDLRAMRDGQAGLTQAVQLTDQELKELQKDLDKVYKEGPQALAAANATTNQFLAQQAQSTQEHEQKLVDLQAQFADAKTAKAKAAVQEKIDAENNGFKEEQTNAAVAYAQQEAAQKAHLGQELIDYINAQATKNSAFREKADALTSEIAKQYGVTESQATNSFGKMLNTIDAFENGTSTDARAVAQHLGTMTEASAATQRQMDALAKKYTLEVEEDLAAHRINAEQYAEKLAEIPTRVYTEIVTAHTDTYETRGDNTGDGHAAGYKASGGPVDAGKGYVVGESGREYFVPNTAGTIIPHDQTDALLNGHTGGGDVTIINVDPGAIAVYALPGMDVEQIADAVLERVVNKTGMRR